MSSAEKKLPTVLSVKGKDSLNAMYAWKYPVLENKHLSANLIKVT